MFEISKSENTQLIRFLFYRFGGILFVIVALPTIRPQLLCIRHSIHSSASAQAAEPIVFKEVSAVEDVEDLPEKEIQNIGKGVEAGSVEVGDTSAEELKEWLSLVSDNGLEMHKREMPAYWRLVSMAEGEDFKSLYSRSRRSPAFEEFFLKPSEHRGELVALDVNIRRILKYPVEERISVKATHLYEIWGWTNQSKSWLYVFVTPELPEGLKEGALVNQTATFSGYFLKLQGYHSGMARKNNQPLVAPLLIGRLGDVHASGQDKKPGKLWQFYVFVSLVGISFLSFITKVYSNNQRRKRHNSRLFDSASPRAKPESFDWIDSIDVSSATSDKRDE